MSDSQLETEVSHSGLDLQIRVRRSPQLEKILPALIKAQAEFDTVAKDMENQAYKRGNSYSKYATLDSVVSATLPHLNKHGLTIIQHLQSDNKSRELIITTSLYHESGQFFESDLTMPTIGANNRFDPQTVASASTYGRRVAWLAIVGAAPSDDDDGNQASGVGSREAAQAVAKKKNSEASSALFYTMPANHNGHFAEFINIQGYLAAHQDIEDSLRMAFTMHKAKKTKDDTAIVPTEHLKSLLEQLAGDMGIAVKELKGNA